MTTIKVSVATRDGLKRLAEQHGRTMGAQITEMVKRERRRQIGRELSSDGLSDEEQMILNASALDVNDALG